jgi:glycosyltransferase involved in cell wall biosynthesis
MVEGVVNPAGRPSTTRPLVSVIIPAHNAAEHLVETVSSALDQTYESVEVIVVNDGSTDDTGAIAAQLGSRIRYVEQANAGPAAARNAALRVARGELIALLDADDRWRPNRLERCVEILEQRPEIGMVTTDANLIEGGVPTEKRSYGDRRRFPFPAHEDEQINEIARRNFLFVGVVFRRELVDRCGDFDERTWGAEDYELWTRFLLSGSRAAFINEPLGWYRLSEGSLSSGARQWEEHLYVLEKHLPALWDQGARGRASDIYDIGEKLAAGGDRKRAAMFFRRAVAGEGASFPRRMKLAAGALLHLARGSQPGAGPGNGHAGADVQPAEPTRG